MKKMLAAMAVVAVLLGLQCGEPVDNFTIVPVGDTVVTIDTSTAFHNFGFTLKNNTAKNLKVILDIPKDLQQLPESWGADPAGICDTARCYPKPLVVDLKANDSILGYHIQVLRYDTLDMEGTAVMTATYGDEVDTMHATLKVTK